MSKIKWFEKDFLSALSDKKFFFYWFGFCNNNLEDLIKDWDKWKIEKETEGESK